MGDEVREHEYELMSYGKRTTSMGNVWWNGKKIEADDPSLLEFLKSSTISTQEGELCLADGIDYLTALPTHFRSYVSARKVVK